jgi:RNA polymerase sigma-32 factor
MAMTVARRNLSFSSFKGGLDAYLQEIRRFPVLEADEEYELATRWRQYGDSEAAQKLVTSHLRLVIKIARGYRGYGLPVADLISEGSIGMMHAVNRFDPDRGVRLATYAMWWIRAAIREYVLRSWSLVKMGTTAAQRTLFCNLPRLKAKLQLIDEGDMSRESVERIAIDLKVTAQDVINMNRRLLAPDRSLNTPVRADSYGEWQDWLVDERDSHENELAERQELSTRRKLLTHALSCLNARERHILAERRLKDDPTTLAELARHYGISRERVRQIEVRAVDNLQKIIRGTIEAAQPACRTAANERG